LRHIDYCCWVARLVGKIRKIIDSDNEQLKKGLKKRGLIEIIVGGTILCKQGIK